MVSCKNPCVCRGRQIGDSGGYEPPLRVRYKIWERLHIGTRPVGEALSLPKSTQLGGSMNGETCVEVANLATRCGFAAGGRLRAAPTRCGGSRELTATNKVHPPQLRVRSAAPPKVEPRGTSHLRAAKNRPYGMRGVKATAPLAGRKLASPIFCCKLPEKQPYFL